jgi:hypothetical protein
MEIKEIDRKRVQEKKDEEARLAKLKSRMAKAERAQKKLKAEKIPKTRLIVYISVLSVLVVSSLTYNLISLSRAGQPVETEAAVSHDMLTIHFFDLCNDIEELKREQGTYPESIEEMKFSDYLTYHLYSDGSFSLAYNDGHFSLSYDSSKDAETIK